MFSLKVLLRNFSYLSVLLLFTTSVYGQQAISGTVRDQVSKQVVSSATVELEGSTAKMETKTDSEGHFLFFRLTPGEYKVSVSATSFQTATVKLTLAPRAVQSLEMTLNPTINEVVEVRAEKLFLDNTQSSSLAVIDPVFIDQLPRARKTSLPDLVSAFIPSAVASHDNFIHLRGNELSLNTSINGVSFIDNPHQYFAPGLDPGVVQSFSVITGGFAAEYGNRFGGIIDAVTRSGFDSTGHGAVTFGVSTFLRNTASAEYGGHTKRLGYFFYVTGFQSQRFINPPEPKELHSFGKGLRTFSQFDFKPSQNNTFRLLLFNSGSNFEIPNTAQDEAVGRDLFQRSREQTAIFTWERTFSPDSLLVTSVSERLVSNKLLPTSDPVSIQASGLRNTVTLGLRSDYTKIVGTRHTIKAGLELTGYRLREDFTFDPRMTDEDEEELARKVPFSGGADEELELMPFNFRGRKSGGVIGFYLQDRVKLFRNLVANVGLRYDKYSLLNSEQQFSPRINLVYNFSGTNTSVHFAYNRLFALPPNENLLLSTSLSAEGKAPRAVKSNSYELGVSQAINRRLFLKVTTFFRDDKNSFELTELANVRNFLPTAFAKGRSYGVEVSAQLPEIPSLGISGYFNYTAQRAFQTGPIAGGFADEVVEIGVRGNPAFDQIHTGTAGITYQQHRTGFYATFGFEYGSGTPSEGIRLADHFVANFYTGIDLIRKEKAKVSLQFNVENLSNRVYPLAKESELTPIQFSSPRYVSAGIRVGF